MASFEVQTLRVLLLALAAFASTAHAGIASLHCIDSHADILENSNFISYTPESEVRYCNDQKECIVHPLLNTDGRDHFGFILFKDYNNTSNKHLRWSPPSSSSTSEYVYLRYYGYKYIGNSEWKVIPAEDPTSGSLEPARDRIWREGCFKMDHTSSEERFLYWDSAGYQSYEYLALDKVIILALDEDEAIGCSQNDVSQIKSYCQDTLFPTPTTTTTTTISTEAPPTEDPNQTVPPPGAVAALHCIDNDADIRSNSLISYEANIRVDTCDDDYCIPDKLTNLDGLDHRGFMVFRDNYPQVQNGKQLGWEQPSSSSTSEYVYLRYFASNYPYNNSTLFAILGAEDPSKASLDKTPMKVWKEGCFKMNHTSSSRRYLQLDSGLPNMEYLVVDKMIVLALEGDETITCNSSHVNQIKQYCQEIFPTPTTPTTISTTEAPPTTLTPTTPEAEVPQAEVEWVDINTDLLNYVWSTAESLQYAHATSDLPCEISGNLTSANGLLFFKGKPEDADSKLQEISRVRSSNAGEAHLYIRYYIHHSSPTDPHQYFVSPVEGKFMGVHYLDATSDFRWKEAFLSLNAQSSGSDLAFQIGTTSEIEDHDYFIIDKIIFMQRRSS